MGGASWRCRGDDSGAVVLDKGAAVCVKTARCNGVAGRRWPVLLVQWRGWRAEDTRV